MNIITQHRHLMEAKDFDTLKKRVDLENFLFPCRRLSVFHHRSTGDLKNENKILLSTLNVSLQSIGFKTNTHYLRLTKSCSTICLCSSNNNLLIKTEAKIKDINENKLNQIFDKISCKYKNVFQYNVNKKEINKFLCSCYKCFSDSSLIDKCSCNISQLSSKLQSELYVSKLKTVETSLEKTIQKQPNIPCLILNDDYSLVLESNSIFNERMYFSETSSIYNAFLGSCNSINLKKKV